MQPDTFEALIAYPNEFRLYYLLSNYQSNLQFPNLLKISKVEYKAALQNLRDWGWVELVQTTKGREVVIRRHFSAATKVPAAETPLGRANTKVSKSTKVKSLPRASQKLVAAITDLTYPTGLDTPEFKRQLTAWAEWKGYRWWSSGENLQSFVDTFKGHADGAKMLQYALTQGWRSCRPDGWFPWRKNGHTHSNGKAHNANIELIQKALREEGGETEIIENEQVLDLIKNNNGDFIYEEF